MHALKTSNPDRVILPLSQQEQKELGRFQVPIAFCVS